MTEKKINIEFIEEKEESFQKTSAIIKGFFDGTLLTRKFVLKQMPFFLFLVLIGLLYISNRYHADRIRNNVVNLKNELNLLHSLSVRLIPVS